MNKYTPGPWATAWTNDVGPNDEYYVEFYEILDSSKNRIGTMENKSDANLVAAAPELLEALKLADALLWGANMNALVVERKVKAAIAKATGETNG